MDIQVWQAIVVPLAIAFLTLVVTWSNNSASLSHQRTQRLRELVLTGAWNKVHPMVLVLDVREAFGMRINLDARALRLALSYQDSAFGVLRDYLAAREFVRVSEDGSRFQRTARANDDRNYRFWPAIAAVSGLVLYTGLILLYAHLAKHETASAWLILPISFMCFFVAFKVSIGLSTANRLFKLGPVVAGGSNPVQAHAAEVMPSNALRPADQIADGAAVSSPVIEVTDGASCREPTGDANTPLHCVATCP